MSKVALITGASRGLGAELAQFLAAQAYHLVLTARGQDELRQTAQALEGYPGSVEAIAGDIADPRHRTALVSALEARGSLDLLVNNASTLGPSPMPHLLALSEQALQRILEVNLAAPLMLVQEAYPYLRRSQGLVVNITSDAAAGGYPGWGGYGASKAALELVSKTLAEELRGDGITVVAVDPGDMRTRMHQEAFPGEDISDRPPPEVTLPFWAWLLGQESGDINGGRFQAQAATWELPV